MKKFLQVWLINTLAVLVAVYMVKGIHYERPLDLAVASLVLGVLDAVLRPLLLLVALPLLLFTLGLFTLIVNALVLYFRRQLVTPLFQHRHFLGCILGSPRDQRCFADP